MRNCLSQRFSRLVRRSGESAGLGAEGIAERLANLRGGGEELSVVSFQRPVEKEGRGRKLKVESWKGRGRRTIGCERVQVKIWKERKHGRIRPKEVGKGAARGR